MIDPPVVRIRRSPILPPARAEKRDGGDGPPSRAPDVPHGVSRVLRGSGAERSALLVRRSRQAVSAAFRCSLPLRGPKAVASDLASLNLARPGRRTPEERRRPLSAGSTLPRHLPLQRIKGRGFGPRGLAAPATFRPRRFTRPRRLAPRDPARAYLIPVTLLGFRLQGLAPHRGARTSLEVRLLSCRSPPVALATPPGARSSELSSPRRVRAAGDRKSPAADALLAFSPLGPSLPPRGSRIFPQPRALADARRRTLPAPPPLRFRRTIGSPRRPTGAPEYSPAEALAFPPPADLARSRGRDSPERRRRPFWGLPPRPERPAEAALECR
jgi:hypothetical protein